MASRSGHLMELGGAITGVGGTFAAGYWIYARETPDVSVWAWHIWLALGGVLVGLALMVIGLLAPSADAGPRQIQRGGKKSRNLQAGRDMHIHDTNEGQ